MTPQTARLLALAFDPEVQPADDAISQRVLDAALELAAASGLRHLTMDDVARRGEDALDCLGDIRGVDERPPRRTVARHPDLPGGPRQAGEVVEHDVESHTRGRTKCRGIPHERRREIVVGERPNIAFDERFTRGVGRLGIGR